MLVFKNNLCDELLDIILQKKPNLNLVTKLGFTCLMFAAQQLKP